MNVLSSIVIAIIIAVTAAAITVISLIHFISLLFFAMAVSGIVDSKCYIVLLRPS